MLFQTLGSDSAVPDADNKRHWVLIDG